MEPVAPRSATRFTKRSLRRAACSSGYERVNGKEGRGEGEENGVDAVEHAAVPPKDAPGVLHAEVALEHGLEEVAERRCERDDHPEQQRLADGEELLTILVQGEEDDEHRG